MPSSRISSRNACTCGSSAVTLTQQVFQLHRRADVAADLQLPGHIRGERILLAFDDAQEDLLRGLEGALATLVALAHRHVAAFDLHSPDAGALDVEDVARVELGRVRAVRSVGQRLEELPYGSVHLGCRGYLTRGRSRGPTASAPATVAEGS